jgi:hypothetical protein
MTKKEELINIKQRISYLKKHSALCARNHDLIAVLEKKLGDLEQASGRF